MQTKVASALRSDLFVEEQPDTNMKNDNFKYFKAISSRVDGASASKTVDLGSILGRVKPKARKISIHVFPAGRSALKETL